MLVEILYDFIARISTRGEQTVIRMFTDNGEYCLACT